MGGYPLRDGIPIIPLPPPTNLPSPHGLDNDLHNRPARSTPANRARSHGAGAAKVRTTMKIKSKSAKVKPVKTDVGGHAGVPTPVERLEKIEAAYGFKIGGSSSHEALRKVFCECAKFVDVVLDDCREKSLVQTKLEEALHWAVQCEDLHPHPDPKPSPFSQPIYSGGTCADVPERVRIALHVWLSHDPATAPTATWTSSGPTK